MVRAMPRAPLRRQSPIVGACIVLAALVFVARVAGAQHPTPSRNTNRRRPSDTSASTGARAAPSSSSPPPSSPAPESSSALPTASAAPIDPVEARRIRAGEEFAAGVAAYRRGDFVAAATHFGNAYETLPDPAPLFNMARAWEGANDIAHAIDAYQRYLAAAPNAPDHHEVEERVTVLRNRPTDVFISTDPPGATVFVDEDAEPQRDVSPLVVRVVPGTHVLVIERQGYQRTVRRFTARPGVPETLSIVLESRNAPAPVNPRVDPRIARRRTGNLVSARFSFQIGAARPWNDRPFAFSYGAAATMYIGRGFTSALHFERIEPDGVWTIGTLDIGYTLAIEDIDIALLTTAGFAYGWIDYPSFVNHSPLQFVPIIGLEARAEWVFHPHISAGIYFRGSLRNLWVVPTAPAEPLTSFGASISLLF
jgi:hypothetical protein